MQTTSIDKSVAGQQSQSRSGNLLSALLGIAGFVGLWGWVVSSGVGQDTVARTFFDLPSILLVTVGPVAVLTAIYGWAGVIDAFLWVFRRPTPGKVATEAVTFFQLGAAFSLASGFLATVVALIFMLSRLEVPVGVGPGLAVALLTQLYGVFGGVICIGLAAHIARRHNGAASALPVTRIAASAAGVTVIAGTLTAMIALGILMLSSAPGF